jgi:hypothetical protein
VMPCSSGPLFLELLEKVERYLSLMGLTSVPIYYISPTGYSCLLHSSILGEWTADEYRSKLCVPEESMASALLLKTNRVQCYEDISDIQFASSFKEPCVIFVSHPSLICGNVLYFRDMFQNDSKHAFLLTEREETSREVMQTWKDQVMIVSIPLDPRISRHDLVECIQQLSPTHIISTIPWEATWDRSELHVVAPFQSFQLEWSRPYEMGYISSELAVCTTMKPLQSGDSDRHYGMLTGCFDRTKKAAEICQLTVYQEQYASDSKWSETEALYYGCIDLNELLDRLTRANIHVKIQQKSSKKEEKEKEVTLVTWWYPIEIWVVDWEANVVLLSAVRTILNCKDETHRRWLKECIQECLVSL